jgi:23S rRNA (guanosine2251-2'-O)-methyltransferase
VITVFGRRAVLEALLDPTVDVSLVLVDREARGEAVDAVVEAARGRSVVLKRVSAAKVTRVSGSGRHDQGVVAEVEAPGVAELDGWLAGRASGPVSLLLLDGVTTPANVGMILRTATAAGLDGVVLPRSGSPDIGPLVVKASAGVAFRASVLAADSPAHAAGALHDSGVTTVGLRGGDAPVLFDSALPERAAYVLGNESWGVSLACDEWRSIPLANGVESLNVAVAAGLVAYEVARRS